MLNGYNKVFHFSRKIAFLAWPLKPQITLFLFNSFCRIWPPNRAYQLAMFGDISPRQKERQSRAHTKILGDQGCRPDAASTYCGNLGRLSVPPCPQLFPNCRSWTKFHLWNHMCSFPSFWTPQTHNIMLPLSVFIPFNKFRSTTNKIPSVLEKFPWLLKIRWNSESCYIWKPL